MADSIYAYKWEGRKTGPRRTKKKTTRSLWKRRGKQALEPEEGGYRALFLGSDALRGRCKLLRDPSGRERRREKEQKTSFLRKEPNECMACPVSVKQRFNTAAFSSRPPPGHS